MTEDSLFPLDLPAVQWKQVTADFVGGSVLLDEGGGAAARGGTPARAAERRTQPRAADRGGFDKLPFANELRDEPVGEGRAFVLIVGDQDRAHVFVPEDPSHLADDRRPELGVEAGKRFVHHEQFPARHHRSGERYPLLFSVRQRMRHAPFVARQSEERQQFVDAAGAFRRHSLAQPETDVARDIEMGKQGEVLKHHAGAPLVLTV